MKKFKIENKIFQFFFVVPSAPPDNVQSGMLNLTAGWVRWSPPSPQHHNGHLLGYKIQVCYLQFVHSQKWKIINRFDSIRFQFYLRHFHLVFSIIFFSHLKTNIMANFL